MDRLVPDAANTNTSGELGLRSQRFQPCSCGLVELSFEELFACHTSAAARSRPAWNSNGAHRASYFVLETISANANQVAPRAGTTRSKLTTSAYLGRQA